MPKTVQGMMDVNWNKVSFNFLKSLDIAAINNETKALDRKAHMFGNFPMLKNKSASLWILSLWVVELGKEFLWLETPKMQEFSMPPKNLKQKKHQMGTKLRRFFIHDHDVSFKKKDYEG